MHFVIYNVMHNVMHHGMYHGMYQGTHHGMHHVIHHFMHKIEMNTMRFPLDLCGGFGCLFVLCIFVFPFLRLVILV